MEREAHQYSVAAGLLVGAALLEVARYFYRKFELGSEPGFPHAGKVGNYMGSRGAPEAPTAGLRRELPASTSATR